MRFMKRPELQLLQVLAAVPEIFPAEHSPQLLAPGLLAYVPGSQFVQLVDAALPANVPALHFVQNAAAVPEIQPAGQAEQFCDDERLNLPVSQSEHAEDPASENVPASHAPQSDDRPPLNLPEGHTEQFSDGRRLNLPESQSEHDVEPVTVLYVPAGQTGHSVSRFAANMALPGVQYMHALPVSI